LSRIKKILLFVLIIFVLTSTWFVHRVIYSFPVESNTKINEQNLVQISPTHFVLNNSWLRLNKYGNWECYIEGNGYDRGRTLGILQKKLGEEQEEVFLNEIDKQIPSWFLKKLLTFGIAWFNRDLDSYIPIEYRTEIFGISEFFSDKFDDIGPKYNRIINYHAAHDIGHAVQNMHLVGCTALGSWQFDSIHQQMIIGRNFDFYFGDDFAKNKVILISNPTKGYKSISVSWPSFIGVVSGINEKGLGITLNSDISEIPTHSGTPVSIIARDILQYASTIQEAIDISNKYTSFVSESFTISSVIDQRIAVIEKTPNSTGVYFSATDTIIVTNHFQSNELKGIPLNIAHIANSESVKRFERTAELISSSDSLGFKQVAEILRDQKGMRGRNIGLGNPMALNQLLAHHAVIFDNVNKFIWVSTYPYQVNKMNAYSLNSISSLGSNIVKFPIVIDSLEVAEDPFLYSEGFKHYEKYKNIKEIIIKATNENTEVKKTLIAEFVNVNPNYYETYRLLGNYFSATKDAKSAIKNYEISLKKDIAYQEDREFIEAQISKLKLDD